jgi:hypothetical protein
MQNPRPVCCYLVEWVIPEKIHTPPTEEISAVWRGEKLVSDGG